VLGFAGEVKIPVMLAAMSSAAQAARGAIGLSRHPHQTDMAQTAVTFSDQADRLGLR
jgi:hypothetical protein